ncbi:MAG: hypothetical protein PQJ59_16785 [Spirochaetales bacterium]|nr:hypothetical protein [Spirochaetales bacterium]
MEKLRKIIGWLAFVFPFALIVFGQWPMGKSISSYYWNNDSVLFVSMLVVCGSFLVFYDGYDTRDNWMTTVAGVGMMVIAAFPCLGDHWYLFMLIPQGVTNIIHGVSATITFGMLGCVSMFQFTQRGSRTTFRKLTRNKIYRICGWVIFGAMAGIGLIGLFGIREQTDSIRLFFWLESIILWAFGVSWLVKGGFILEDK